MEKPLIMFLVICLILIFGHPVESKRYKGIFNLASDPRYYKYVEYKSSHTFEDILKLTVIDKRPEQERVYNKRIQYFYDDIWTEPPARMLEKIFLKELRLSKMFKSVDIDEKAPSLILEIELNSLIGHYGRGRMAKGIVKIHSILKSTSDIGFTYSHTSAHNIPYISLFLSSATSLGDLYTNL